MTIRPITIEDFDEVYSLWKRTNLLEFSYDKEKEEAEKMIKWNPTSCLVGIVDDKIIASIFGVFNGRRAWIYRFGVATEHQNKGYGSQILEATERELKKIGATQVLLWVTNNNKESIPFYLKKNYKVYDGATPLLKSLK